MEESLEIWNLQPVISMSSLKFPLNFTKLDWFSKLSFSLASALLVKEFLTITLTWLISRRIKEGKWKKREDCRRHTACKLNYIQKSIFRSICFHSVTESCRTLWNPMTAPLQASLSVTISQTLPKFMCLELVLLSNHPAPPPPFPFSLSDYQGLFQRAGSLHQVAKVLELELQLQHPSFP